MIERCALPWLLLVFVACRADEPAASNASAPPAHILPTELTTPAATEPTRAQRFEALRSEYQTAFDAFANQFMAAKSDEERRQISASPTRPDGQAFGARLLPIFEEDPTDELAFTILRWVPGHQPELLDQAKACAAIEKFHFERPELDEVVARADVRSESCMRALVIKLADASPHASVRSAALYRLGTHQKEEMEEIHRVHAIGSAEERTETARQMGKKRVQELADADPEAAERQAIEYFERVVAECTSTPRDTSLAKRANAELFELKNLLPGKTAPEIEGEDLDGVKFKLSDYRGKLVLLDFWGFW